MGYRWFDTKNIEPLFPFGHGLSYTAFEYSNLKLTPTETGVTAEFEIRNSGQVEGAEVVQLYVHPVKPGVLRPEKELKGFKKIFLKPGERQTVSVPLSKAAFAFYSPELKSWVAEQGAYKILAGGSSRNLPLQGEFQLAETSLVK